MDHNLLARFSVRIGISVPTNDYRNHPDTLKGDHHFFGNGVMHHDLINIPFFGRMYDTAVVRHPLSMTDRYDDRRPTSTHVFYLLDVLRDIQWQSQDDETASQTELRARQDSIDVLRGIQKGLYASIVGPDPSSPSESSESSPESSESSGDNPTSASSYASSNASPRRSRSFSTATAMLDEDYEEASKNESLCRTETDSSDVDSCEVLLYGSEDHCLCQRSLLPFNDLA